MIRVTIEMHPGGSEEGKYNLGTIDISNDGRSFVNPAKGTYNASLYKKGKSRILWKRVKVVDFPRGRLGAYDLLYRVLREAVGDRNEQE